MELIFSWVMKIGYLFILFFGVYLLFKIAKPIFELYTIRMQSGKFLTMEDVKNVVMTVLTTSGLMLFVPFIFLTVILLSIQLALPVADDISNTISQYLTDVIYETTGKQFDTTNFDITTLPTPEGQMQLVDPNTGGGVPQAPQPTQTPYIIYVNPETQQGVPTPNTYFSPTPIVTPTVEKTLR